MALAGHGVRAATPSVLHPRAFAAPAPFAAQVAALVAVLEEVRPQVVITYASDGGYGHPDHVRAHDITVAALAQVPAGLARLAGGPFRLPAPDELPSVPDATITTRVDVSAQREHRIAAMRAHATQIALADGAFAMSNGVAQPLLDVEEYVSVHRCGSFQNPYVIDGHGSGTASSPSSPTTRSPAVFTTLTRIPGGGPAKRHSCMGTTGLPVSRAQPISVPPVWFMIGTRPRLTCSCIHLQAAAVIGSPAEAMT